MKQFLTLCLLLVLSLVLLSAEASSAKKKRVYYREQFYYVDEQMYLCSITNRATQRVFYGQSPKRKYAVMYARGYCQMQSYAGQCYIKPDCNWEYVKVRKRRYVRSS